MESTEVREARSIDRRNTLQVSTSVTRTNPSLLPRSRVFIVLNSVIFIVLEDRRRAVCDNKQTWRSGNKEETLFLFFFFYFPPPVPSFLPSSPLSGAIVRGDRNVVSTTLVFLFPARHRPALFSALPHRTPTTLRSGRNLQCSRFNRFYRALETPISRV